MAEHSEHQLCKSSRNVILLATNVFQRVPKVKHERCAAAKTGGFGWILIKTSEEKKTKNVKKIKSRFELVGKYPTDDADNISYTTLEEIAIPTFATCNTCINHQLQSSCS